MAGEALLTPRSDTASNESSSASPPDRAPSESSSSGVHSGEERDEIVIRSGSVSGASARPSPYKPIIKPIPTPIEEEPFGRSTNMRMSSFNINQNNNNNMMNNNSHQSLPGSYSMNNNMSSADCPASSATLPLLRSGSSLIDYQPREYPHCSTMPLPGNNTNQYGFSGRAGPGVIGGSNIAAAAAVVAQSKHLNQLNNNTNNSPATSNQSSPAHVTHVFVPQHTTLPNGVRYANPMLTRRVPHLKNAESPYGVLGLGSGHHTFSKLLHDPLMAMAIPEGGGSGDCILDSTNYAIISEELYLADLTGACGGAGTSTTTSGNYVMLPPMDNHSIYANNNHHHRSNN